MPHIGSKQMRNWLLKCCQDLCLLDVVQSSDYPLVPFSNLLSKLGRQPLHDWVTIYAN